MQPAIIEVNDLSKRYRLGQFSARSMRDEAERLFSRRRRAADMDVTEFWALRNVSFQVQQGDVLGVIGRNGAGKSTLLKLLSRVTEPTQGEVRIRGRVASLLEVGAGFHPELTGRENIFLNGAILGMTRAEIRRKFDEIVAFAEVERFLDTPVKRYSSGMYVRLAFAVAAHLEPEILIIDEVMAVGDAAFQKKCLDKMKEVSRRHGRTVLIVSHNMAIVQSLARKTVFLDKGKLVFFGDTSKAITAYLNDASYLTNFNTDMTAHPNRRPGMHHVIRSFQVFDQDGQPARHFPQGVPITFVIDYDATRTGLPVCGLGVLVDSSTGTRVTSLATYFNQVPPFRLPPKGTIKFEMREPRLNPGLYHLSVCMTEQQFSLLDAIEPGASVEITPADIYSTGFVLSGQDGIVAASGELEIRELAESSTK